MSVISITPSLFLGDKDKPPVLPIHITTPKFLESLEKLAVGILGRTYGYGAYSREDVVSEAYALAVEAYQACQAPPAGSLAAALDDDCGFGVVAEAAMLNKISDIAKRQGYAKVVESTPILDQGEVVGWEKRPHERAVAVLCQPLQDDQGHDITDTVSRWQEAEQQAEDRLIDEQVAQFLEDHGYAEDAEITGDIAQRVRAYAALGEVDQEAIITADEAAQILGITQRGWELRVQRSNGAIQPLVAGRGNLKAYYQRSDVERLAGGAA